MQKPTCTLDGNTILVTIPLTPEYLTDADYLTRTLGAEFADLCDEAGINYNDTDHVAADTEVINDPPGTITYRIRSTRNV